MKKHFSNTLVFWGIRFYTLFITLVLIISTAILKAQTPSYFLEGPHETFTGPYQVRIYVNYVNVNNWTANADLVLRTTKIVNHLNNIYNPYHIFFVGDNSCEVAYGIVTNPNESHSNIHPGFIDIFDIGDAGGQSGYAYDVPNNYLEVSGSDGIGPASQSEVIIHEIGHCLGLSHIFYDGCDESVNSCASGALPCYCCGDYVCDTPISPQNITVSTDCSVSTNPVGLQPVTFRNYMSYSTPGRCRDQFTEGQVKRMWDYLAKAPTLLNVQPVTIFPNNVPTSTTGDIIIESGELVINSTLSMLPGSKIVVKPGASLRINATITGACDKMWEGIIVEGTTLDITQSGQYQGRVYLGSTGKVEHAKVAIDVQDPLVDGTGGGIIETLGGRIENNTIGIRFGAYTGINGGAVQPNKSKIVGTTFTITDTYRGDGTISPTHLILTNIYGLPIRLAKFRDDRGTSIHRAVGIDSRNGGFRAYVLTSFSGLSKGIITDKLTALSGSFDIHDCYFKACLVGVDANIKDAGFSLASNNFIFSSPEPALSNVLLVGSKVTGKTLDMTFQSNIFQNGEPENNNIHTIGTICDGIGGFTNVIQKNEYYEIETGNQADNINSGNLLEANGLHYLCNYHENENTLASSENNYFFNGSVRQQQGKKLSGTAYAPTGNIFSVANNRVNNLYSTDVNYYYYSGSVNDFENPTVDFGSTGIVPFAKTEPNTDCVQSSPPCDPCNEITLNIIKDDFFTEKELKEQKISLANLATDESIKEQLRNEAKGHRIEMSEKAGKILRYYTFDTTGLVIDSIYQWLGNTETYETHITLAKYYFFNGNKAAFEEIWSEIPKILQESSPKREDTNDSYEWLEYKTLTEFYQYLGKVQDGSKDFSHLNKEQIDFLIKETKNCNESAFIAEALLRRNGVEIEIPCSIIRNRFEKKERYDDGSSLSKISIAPNPATDQVTVTYSPSVQDGSIWLSDILGNRIVEAQSLSQSTQITLPLKVYPGVYFVNHSRNGSISSIKLIVN